VYLASYRHVSIPTRRPMDSVRSPVWIGPVAMMDNHSPHRPLRSWEVDAATAADHHSPSDDPGGKRSTLGASTASPASQATALRSSRPARVAPYQTISDAGLISWGHVPMPGDTLLAHRGVLFLDEFPEFRRYMPEVLRQPRKEVHGGNRCLSAPFLLSHLHPWWSDITIVVIFAHRCGADAQQMGCCMRSTPSHHAVVHIHAPNPRASPHAEVPVHEEALHGYAVLV
jgi:hypothetical protein